MIKQTVAARSNIYRNSEIVRLKDGRKTEIYRVRYDRKVFKPQLIKFAKAERLLDWCNRNSFREAMVGGYYLKESKEILGELWLSGKKHVSAPVISPWHLVRGSVYLDDGDISLGYRYEFPDVPRGSLFQAGPMLIRNGQIVDLNKDSEGISRGALQFDSNIDITKGRFPRAAIGLTKDHIWSVVCDGRSEEDAGMTLDEMAGEMLNLGAETAINLDGGSSATQISGGVLRNIPRGDEIYLRGYPIFTAILFEYN